MEKTVEELRSLLAKATERPWIVDADMTPAKERVYFVKKERAKAVVAFVGNERYPFSEPDAQLIAAAVNALPALLDRLASVENQEIAGTIVCGKCRADMMNPKGPTVGESK